MHGAKSLLHSSIKLIRQSLGLWKPAKHNLISYCLYVIRERGMINILGYKLENFFYVKCSRGLSRLRGGAVVHTAKVKLSLLPLFAFAYLFPMITPTHNNFLNSKENCCKIQKPLNLTFLKTHGTKGQIKPKADWRAIDSPKKRTKEFV